LEAQNIIGVPEVINYTKTIYGAGTQNRGIVQDKNGVMYFANYEGLLSFDGNYWKNYPLSNKTVVRSVALGRDNRIYVGGQDDFGYFSPGTNGRLVYTSLKNLLPVKNYSFSDVWFTVSYGNDIFFMSRERIIQLSNNILTVYPAASEWLFLGESNNQLIAQDGKNGLLEFKAGIWSPFLSHAVLHPNYLVTCIFPYGTDSSFISTVNTGFYILHHNSITPFKISSPNPFVNERVLTAIAVNNNWLAIGTYLDGVYIVDKNGKVIQNISRKEDLQLNNVLKLFEDNNKNLWLGLDNGIDFVVFSNAIKHIYPEKLNEGLGYTSIVFNNRLYLGTSNGFYSLPITDREDLSFSTGNFKSIPGAKGSTFGLSVVNGQLLVGHHDGAFQVKGDEISPLDLHTSFWTFLPYANVLPSNIILGGCDMGINFFQYENGQFISRGSISGFDASAQYIAIENNSIWTAHPYRGVYKINMNQPDHPAIKLYTEKNGLPSYLKNHLFRVKNHVVITTERGIYEYNEKTDSFSLSPYFRNLFGEKNIRYLTEDDLGNIWFIEDNNLGVIDYSTGEPETIDFPELNGKMVADFEHIYPYNKKNVFVGAEKGFYHINYENYKKNHYKMLAQIRSVKISGKTDSILFGGYFGEIGQIRPQQRDSVYKIPTQWSSIHFEYSSPLYEAQKSVKYSYMLQGFEREWSSWSDRSEKDYTNLSAGTYTFMLKSRNNKGEESAISSYSFIILPPWYQTNIAIALYLIGFVGFNFLFYKWLRKQFKRQQERHEREQKRLQYLHQLEMDKSEKEIVKLRNEKLETELGHKNKELASTAMHLVQKGELLGNVREELIRLKKGHKGQGSPDEFKKMLKILNEENKIDKDWEQFAVHFDLVHSNFLQMLKSVYPFLSAHEQKLSAYLRMNMSSKEIAKLENISVRGVEISRYRLRKKLKISPDTKMFDFLVDLHENANKSTNGNGSGNGYHSESTNGF
jgi:ligand-binding sensor domain-containing protein